MLKTSLLGVCTAALFLVMLPLSSAFSAVFFMGPTEGSVKLELKNPETSLEEISFYLPEKESGFTLRMAKVSPDADWVYDYFWINVTGMRSEPDLVSLVAKVNRTWLSEKNVDMQTIYINIFDGSWKRLKTDKISEDSGYVYYRADSPKLSAFFAVTGEPVPVKFDVNTPCNNDGVCNGESGEDNENCPDCISRLAVVCIPGERYCMEDSLFVCRDDGLDYSLVKCDAGCAGGACVSPEVGITGALLSDNPVYISVIAVLLTVIVYLTMMVRRTRHMLHNAERTRHYHEDIKDIAKRKK